MSTPEFCAQIARAGGFTAWWLLSAAVLWGLLLSTRVIGPGTGATRRVQAHRQLAAAALVFTAIHLAALAVDPRLLFGWAEFLVPLPTRHRPLAGAWGVIAVYLMTAIQATSLMRSRLPQRLWRHVHQSSFAVFVLVTLHALTAGKATGDPLTGWTATITATAFGLLVAHRLHAPRRIARTVSRLRHSRHPRPTTPPAPTAPGFHRLQVTDIRRETPDTVSVAFDIPAELTAAFRFRPGQHLTLRAFLDGTQALRPYSICSGIADGELRIAVKQQPGGKVSTWINTRLRTGDQVDIAPPRGRFTTDLDPLHKRHLLAIAAGSGITPVISIIKSVLAAEPHSRCTLLYSSRDSQSTIFRGQLALLSCTYGDRLRVIHVHSRGHCPDPLLRGRLTGAKIRELADVLALTHDLSEAFLCGPSSLIADIRAALTELGLAPQHIHTEQFSGHPQATPAPSGGQRPYGGRSAGTETGARTARVHLIDRGEHTTLTIPAPQTVLDAGLHAGLDLPHSCREGFCGTCRAKVTKGQVRLLAPCALQPADIDAGYVLACRTTPVGDGVTIDFDQG